MVKHKKTLLLSPLALIPAGVHPAAAAPPHPVAAAAWMPSWTGFYIGANLGGVSENSSQTSFSPVPGSGNSYCFGSSCGTNSQTATGVLGGFQIGYNFQSGNWIYGVEADFDFSNARKQTSGIANPSFLGTWTAKTGIDDFGTAQLRLGYNFNNFMPYVTGGLAYGNVVDTFQGGSGGSFPYTWAGTGWRAGYAVGGGLEVLVSRNIAIKGEALYYDLGSENHFPIQQSIPVNVFGVTDRMTGVVGRIGINYLFH